MKRVKIAAVSLAGALLLTSFVGSGFAGCGGGSSSSSSTTAPTTPNTPDTPGTPVTPGVETNNTVIFQSLKTSNLFYYLGKDSDADPTNTIVTNALDNNYSLIVIDMEASDAEDVATLKTTNQKFVICDFSAGTLQTWRTDAGSFTGTHGYPHEDAADELWLNINEPAVLSFMKARIDAAATKGCQGVEFDNVDGFDNNTSFTIAAADQLTYNRALADYAHSKNLITVLKSDVEQVDDLNASFDMAVNESCHMRPYDSGNECDLYNTFLLSKPVFNIEYRDNADYNATKVDSSHIHTQGDFFKSYLTDTALDGSYYVRLPLP